MAKRRDNVPRGAGGGSATGRNRRDPKPPPPILPASEAAEKMAEVLPLILGELAPLFAKSIPWVSRKKSAAMRRGLRRYFAAIRPYVIALEALKPGLNQPRLRYALIEGQVRELLRAGRRKVGEREDALAVALQMLEKLVSLPRGPLGRNPAYRKTRNAVARWATAVAAASGQEDVRRLRSEWWGSTDARAFVRFTRPWIQLAEKLPESEPKRLTEPFVERLARSYSECAAGTERCLRVMVALDPASGGHARSWSDWRKTGFAQLQQMVKAERELACVAGLVDRHVRNALAHGLPEFDAARGMCKFYDREHETTWTAAEFLERTRNLVYGLGAAMQFDNALNLAYLQAFTKGWWTVLAAERPGQSSSSRHAPDEPPA